MNKRGFSRFLSFDVTINYPVACFSCKESLAALSLVCLCCFSFFPSIRLAVVAAVIDWSVEMS